MRILFHYNLNKTTGMGHAVRSLALLDEARLRGHAVAVAGDHEPPRSCPWFEVKPTSGIYPTLDKFAPDWVVVDVPEAPPRFGETRPYKVCVIDGVGLASDIKPDLSISQGFKGEHCAPKHLILRKALARYVGIERGDHWLVYGGASDPLGLLPAFNQTMRDEPANLLVTDFTEVDCAPYSGWYMPHSRVTGDGDAVLGWLATAGQAAVHLGVICWELAYFGVPQYIFSRSERHLETALEFERRGYGLAWPDVGLPDDKRLREFLETPFTSTGEKPDLEGARRVVELMEM